ncbi:DUF6221 family protein [Streptomyces sp. V4-01]|uniref:DUF6221 family protein n=1 Tax=Actinacidiphila polyblastidii TaxID=3110430 RepID=A0ABU7PKS0_9ACTN|nr:DUF6221 family protein [Streptomyces sp. V4-01]
MDDLVAFLRARIADDLAEAQKQDDERSWVIEPWRIRRDEYEGNYTYREYLQIAKARVLREVEAKRAAIEDYERSLENSRVHPDDLPTSGALLARLGAVKLLASVHADHPDYRPEWAPTA